MPPLSRRRFVQLVATTSALAAIPALIACRAEEEPAPAASTPGGGSTAATTAARRGPSTGELRVSEPFLAATLDPDSGTASFNLQSLGVAETLLQYTPTLEVQPFLAKSLERVDDLTWKVVLRDDLTFTDGTKVDAEAVKVSLMRSMEKQPSVADLLPKDTVLAADGLELTIRTSAPMGLMPKNLAAANLAIKKVVGDSFVFTGPYEVKQFTARESITLAAYQQYRGGPAWIQAITARQVADTATRSLALQSGDVEVAQALLPSDVAKLKAAGREVSSAPWARQHMIVLNVTQPPLDDVAVRRAFSLSIDREALVDGVLEGVGAPAYGIAPEEIGLKGIVRTQQFDRAEAARILDAAGWRPGADGIREKDGKRLAFKLGTYAGRAELEQFAVVIIDMAKAVGIDVSIEKFPDVEVALGNNAFAATTYSIGSAAFGDLSRLLATLYTPSPRNKDRYDNPKVTAGFHEFLKTSDAARQDALLEEMQTAIGDDLPIVHLVNPYQVVGFSKKLKHFAPHPLDSYKYHADLSLDA